MTITIILANHGKGRFKYILESRHMFGRAYSKEGVLEWQHTPDHILERDQYALGFWSPNYPVPAVI